MRVCDIHCHILPGIDDGSRSVGESLLMLQSLYDQGARDVFCASHNWHEIARYQEQFDLLRQKAAHIGINLYPGCEVLCDTYEMPDVLSGLANGTIPTMNHTQYVLAEFDPYEAPEEIVQCAEQLINAGWKVIVAHIERCRMLHDAWDVVERLRELGCLFQVNAYSLQEEQNEKTKQFARAMLAKEWVSFLGSDAHQMQHRPPEIQSGIAYISGAATPEYSKKICYRNAQEILIGNINRQL